MVKFVKNFINILIEREDGYLQPPLAEINHFN
jgi:hypothetical protein